MASQQLGIDCDETFSPVVKPATIHIDLSLTVSRKWPIHQLDVKNAFLNRDLSEIVYMHQPGFVDSRYPHHIIVSLHRELDMTDLGALNYFLGISVAHHYTGLFLSQQKVQTGPEGVLVPDPSLYHSLARGDNLLTWSSKRQQTLSRSSAEAEYRGVANVVAETAWLRGLVHELNSPLSTITLVYCDNVNAIYFSANPVQHQRTKHIEIDIYFICDMVTTG
ncbi:ribonuclease H-like domain-containing protein [Tanacetum coccineum]